MNNNRHTEDEYYTRIMRELVPGEQEYDRLMRCGQAPSQQKVHRTRRLAIWASAACIALVCGLALMLWPAADDESAPRFACVEQEVMVIALTGTDGKVLVIPGKYLPGEDGWQPGQMSEDSYRMLETFALLK